MNDLSKMSNAELRAEISRLQQELTLRVCGSPIGGVGLKVHGSSITGYGTEKPRDNSQTHSADVTPIPVNIRVQHRSTE